jgi:hypothetical protein
MEVNKQGHMIVLVNSDSGDKQYRVDLTAQKCSCPGWIFSKNYPRNCKHLRRLGYSDEVLLEQQEAAGKYPNQIINKPEAQHYTKEELKEIAEKL